MRGGPRGPARARRRCRRPGPRRPSRGRSHPGPRTGGPNATTRPASRQTRSQRAVAHARSWLETTTVRPSSRRRPRIVREGRLGRGVGARERLVEEQEVGFLHECARQQHALALAAGELADLAAGVPAIPPRSERRSGPVAIVVRRPPQPARPAVGALEGDVAGREREVPSARAELGYEARRPVDRDRAGGGPDRSEECAQERRLAGAVRADEADDGAAGERERHVLHAPSRSPNAMVRPSTIARGVCSIASAVRSLRTARSGPGSAPSSRSSSSNPAAALASRAGSSAQPSSTEVAPHCDADQVVVMARARRRGRTRSRRRGSRRARRSPPRASARRPGRRWSARAGERGAGRRREARGR